jgi:hypothetical protein
LQRFLRDSGRFSEKRDGGVGGSHPEVNPKMNHLKLVVVLALVAAVAGTAGVVAASSGSTTVGQAQANAVGDDDGDGIRNWADADYALPILSGDADGDGVANGEDSDWPKYAFFLDDDGDGIRNGGDADYALPILSGDADGDGISNAEDPDWTMPAFLTDDDGDGIRNWADVDSPLPPFGPGHRHRHGMGPDGACGFQAGANGTP